MGTLNKFDKRKARVRRTLKARSEGRPRLSVHRSSKHIYAQIIDAVAGTTLAAASTMEKDLRGSLKTGANKDAAAAIGKLVAERAVKAGVKEVVMCTPVGRDGETGTRCPHSLHFNPST